MEVRDKSIGRWISILYRFTQSYLDKELKSYEIGSGQFIFLVVLLKQDGISQDKLANYLAIDKGTTARAIKKLEEAGYVVRKIDPADKRVNKVFVTTRALEMQPILHGVSEKWTQMLVANFTEEEKEMVITLLKKMADNAALSI